MKNKLPITDDVLDKLGFSEYWDEHGTWGGRTLTFQDGTKFRIIEQEQMDDDTEGYASNGVYIANHWSFAGWFALGDKFEGSHDLYFLHEMQECIEKFYPQCHGQFVVLCENVRMKEYLKLPS